VSRDEKAVNASPMTTCAMRGDTRTHRESCVQACITSDAPACARIMATSWHPVQSCPSGWHGWVLARSAGLRVSRARSSKKRSRGAVVRVGGVGAHWGPSLRTGASKPPVSRNALTPGSRLAGVCAMTAMWQPACSRKQETVCADMLRKVLAHDTGQPPLALTCRRMSPST
jgi:hypothetical protein